MEPVESKSAILLGYLTYLLAAITFIFLVIMEVKDDIRFGAVAVLCSAGCATVGYWSRRL